MKYRIKDATNRMIVDLTNHSQNIISGVHSVFSNVTVNVYTDYFEIINLPSNVMNSDLRKMGQEILSRDNYLHAMAKVYYYNRSNGSQGKSVQLFENF